MPPTYTPGRRSLTVPLIGLVLVCLVAGLLTGIHAHHHSRTPTAAVASTSTRPGPSSDPLAGVTPMDASGVAGFPLTHMTITQDGVTLIVTIDDGAATPKLSVRETVPLNGTPVTPAPGTGCVTIPGQVPACVMRLQAHQNQVTAQIEAQPGQCELTGSTTPGVRTQIRCATTRQ